MLFANINVQYKSKEFEIELSRLFLNFIVKFIRRDFFVASFFLQVRFATIGCAGVGQFCTHRSYELSLGD